MLLDYFREPAQTTSITEHIRFGTRGVSAGLPRKESATGSSPVALVVGGQQLVANVLVSVVGQLHTERAPIAVADTFRGPVVPLGGVGSRRRPRGEACRGDRHRRDRGPILPHRRRCGRAARVPAHTQLVHADAAACYSAMPDEMQRLLANAPFTARYRFWSFRLSGAPPAARVDAEWHSDIGAQRTTMSCASCATQQHRDPVQACSETAPIRHSRSGCSTTRIGPRRKLTMCTSRRSRCTWSRFSVAAQIPLSSRIRFASGG